MNYVKRLEEKIETKDFIIDAQTKENDRHILTFKFIVDILLLISQLEKVMADNTVLSDAIKLAIATFKVELSKAIQTIQYDGGYSYTFDTSINNDNSVPIRSPCKTLCNGGNVSVRTCSLI